MKTDSLHRFHNHAVALRERSQSMLYHAADLIDNKAVTDSDRELINLRLDTIEHEVKAMRNLIGERK